MHLNQSHAKPPANRPGMEVQLGKQAVLSVFYLLLITIYIKPHP